MSRLLAVAYQTADSEEFVTAIAAATQADPANEVFLLVPATPVTHLAVWTEGESRAVAAEKAKKARARLEQDGVEVSEVRIGDPDPFQAVMNVLATESFDSMIVSTFAPGLSRWLKGDLISRLQQAAGIPVTHITAR